MEFNLQDFLRDMRQEQNDSHVAMSRKIDNVLNRVNDHETRLILVEQTRKTVRWVVGILITGGVGVLYQVVAALIKHTP